MISLLAEGLTTGEISAHMAEVYGAEVSKRTISTITERVMDGMAEWQNRPLDPVYPVGVPSLHAVLGGVFIDCILPRKRGHPQSRSATATWPTGRSSPASGRDPQS